MFEKTPKIMSMSTLLLHRNYSISMKKVIENYYPVATGAHKAGGIAQIFRECKNVNNIY